MPCIPILVHCKLLTYNMQVNVRYSSRSLSKINPTFVASFISSFYIIQHKPKMKHVQIKYF